MWRQHVIASGLCRSASFLLQAAPFISFPVRPPRQGSARASGCSSSSPSMGMGEDEQHPLLVVVAMRRVEDLALLSRFDAVGFDDGRFDNDVRIGIFIRRDVREGSNGAACARGSVWRYIETWF